jgi:sucrose-6-phosphate hydrolase SacC (GH32 family)
MTWVKKSFKNLTGSIFLLKPITKMRIMKRADLKLWRRGFVLLLLLLSFGKSYSQDSLNYTDCKYNPEYHYFPSIDPTGLFHFGGLYYLNWGSAFSEDLVHWKVTDVGLERNRMTVGVFSSKRIRNSFGESSPFSFGKMIISPESGSAVVDWNNTSGFGINGQPPLIAVQENSAYSLDTAKSWVPYTSVPMNFGNALEMHRDAKVFWYEPEKKWVKVLGWTEIYKIKFFSSKNLKDWEYMCEFGPWGAADGQWECSDFFRLPVDGDTTNMKWVLMVNDQPRSGEYFIGDFNGTKFTMDQEFIDALTYDRYMPEGEMLFDFERGLDGWKMEGNAFLESPSEVTVHGREGRRSINSARGGFFGDPSAGRLTSPEFTVSRKCINFLVGGDNYPGDECVNLLVDGKVVRTQTGNGGNSHLAWAGWDVSEFMGKKARIEIVDNLALQDREGTGWIGAIYCDAIMQCDELPRYRYNDGWDDKAFWIDWGKDYYAARSWSNYAPGEKRVIWTGFMGNWTYAHAEPIVGLISIPRNVELKTFPEGIRMVQNPVKELESLRTEHKIVTDNVFEGVLTPKKFSPGRNCYELIVEFENISAEEFGVNICVGGDQKTVVGYNVAREELFVDRRMSGLDDFSSVFPDVSRGPLKNRTGITRLHIFVDKCSVEVFGNSGETTITSKIYPDPESTGITLFSNNGKIKVTRAELWELGSINLY